jgi:hypothetical protein
MEESPEYQLRFYTLMEIGRMDENFRTKLKRLLDYIGNDYHLATDAGLFWLDDKSFIVNYGKLVLILGLSYNTVRGRFNGAGFKKVPGDDWKANVPPVFKNWNRLASVEYEFTVDNDLASIEAMNPIDLSRNQLKFFHEYGIDPVDYYIPIVQMIQSNSRLANSFTLLLDMTMDYWTSLFINDLIPPKAVPYSHLMSILYPLFTTPALYIDFERILHSILFGEIRYKYEYVSFVDLYTKVSLLFGESTPFTHLINYLCNFQLQSSNLPNGICINESVTSVVNRLGVSSYDWGITISPYKYKFTLIEKVLNEEGLGIVLMDVYNWASQSQVDGHIESILLVDLSDYKHDNGYRPLLHYLSVFKLTSPLPPIQSIPSYDMNVPFPLSFIYTPRVRISNPLNPSNSSNPSNPSISSISSNPSNPLNLNYPNQTIQSNQSEVSTVILPTLNDRGDELVNLDDSDDNNDDDDEYKPTL